MASAIVSTIARQQWRLLVRDRRLAILGVALLLVLLTTLATGTAGTAAHEADRTAAQAEEARVWALQGDANPHGAAHFGRYVFKPVSPLAAIDPGLPPQLGSALRLEAHMQNPASVRTIDGGVALDRFAGLSPATMLQLLAPLLVILAGFGAFAGNASRALLRQELASGISPAALLAGRLAGLSAMILLVLAVVFTAGLIAVLASGGDATRRGSNLFALLQELTASDAWFGLSADERAAVARAIRNFGLDGVALEGADRERYRAVQVELGELGRQFSDAVLDATDAWSELIEDEAMLAGVSASDKGSLAADADAVGKAGWLVTLRQPTVSAILSFAENRDLRFRVYQAFGTRASDEGPYAGRFDNAERIARILDLRRESARLLGFADPVDRSLADKMASGIDEILAFLRDLARRVRRAAEADAAELRSFAAESLGIETLEPWDAVFASDRLKRERHQVEEEEVKAYFPIDTVLQGWKGVLRTLFGLELRLRADVSTWHEDAHFYDLVDSDGAVIAGLYVDLFARRGKRGGAWMADARLKRAGQVRPSTPSPT